MREEKGMTEDEMVGWHHQLNGHEFEQAPGHGGGQGSLACYSAGCRKESERTELLNNKNKMYTAYFVYVFIHSWIFDCFHHLLTIGSNAAMNVDVQLSLENRSFFLIACTYLFFKNFFLMENFKHVKK